MERPRAVSLRVTERSRRGVVAMHDVGAWCTWLVVLVLAFYCVVVLSSSGVRLGRPTVSPAYWALRGNYFPFTTLIVEDSYHWVQAGAVKVSYLSAVPAEHRLGCL